MIAENRTWQELCEAASQESDSEQLLTLVSELVKALDKSHPTSGRSSCQLA